MSLKCAQRIAFYIIGKQFLLLFRELRLQNYKYFNTKANFLNFSLHIFIKFVFLQTDTL